MNEPKEESALKLTAAVVLGVAAFVALGWLVRFL